MRGKNITIIVSVAFPGTLTPITMQSIAAKLAGPPIQLLARQIRKRHLHAFKLNLGAGVEVTWPPAKNGLRVHLP